MGAAAPRSPVTAIPLGKGSTGLQEKVGELTKVTTLGISCQSGDLELNWAWSPQAAVHSEPRGLPLQGSNKSSSSVTKTSDRC